MDDASKKPSVLVLLSTYNGENYLQEQVRSILAQDSDEVHVYILIRDDGSSDGTVSVLERLKCNRLSWYRGDNLGWRESFIDLLYKSGEYDFYAFSDQDDVWLPGKLKRAVDCLASMPEGPCLYFSNLITWRNDRREGLAKKRELKVDKYRCMVQCLATGNTMVFNRELKEIICRNPHPQYLLSHDFWVLQVAALLGHVHYDPDSFILYRQHGDNQVGVQRSLRWDLKRKMYDVSIFLADHRRQKGAQELLRCYGPLMDKETEKIVRVVAGYRSHPCYRLRLLFSRKYVMDTFFRNVLLKMRVVAGRV